MRRPMDPATSVQPTDADDELADVPALIAPAALTEYADRVSVSGRHARVIGVSRYPARLHPGWLGDLQAFDGDLDLALHIWRSPSQPGCSRAGRSEEHTSELQSRPHLVCPLLL